MVKLMEKVLRNRVSFLLGHIVRQISCYCIRTGVSQRGITRLEVSRSDGRVGGGEEMDGGLMVSDDEGMRNERSQRDDILKEISPGIMDRLGKGKVVHSEVQER